MSKTKKALSIVLIAILVANITLFAFGKVGNWQFWTSIGVIALLTHFALPRIR